MVRINPRGAAGLCAVGFAAAALAGCAAPRQPRSAVTPQIICTETRFPIYFETGSDQLTPIARQVIGDYAQRLKGCRIEEVGVVGLAVKGAAPQFADLPRKRAAATAQALQAAGFPAPMFDIETVPGARLYRRSAGPELRSTEVIIQALPPGR